MRPLLLLLTVSACDPAGGKPDDTHTTDDTAAAPQGWCAVQGILNDRCTACHGSTSPSGDLDLVTDPHAALVGVASALYTGRTLVVPGDPDGSFLLLKVTGAQLEDEGTPMPPGGSGLDAADAELVRAWITDGATSACDSPDTGTGDGYHPPGWEAPTEHGMAAKHQEDNCLSCHGDDLTGGSAGVSCDMCHDAVDDSEVVGAWRTNCTWCHGGVDNESGAPPQGISDETDANATSFPPHTTHVEVTTLKSALDCTECHVKPTDIFSPGHLFVGDSTPGVADLSFAAGLSDATRWSGGTCSNSYCHGTGQGDNGTVSVDTDVRCGSCHAVTASGEDAWDRMSGEHEDHLEAGLRCAECHGDTVDARDQIVDVTLHVNGAVNLRLPDGMSRTGDTCSGSCHGETHSGRRWD